MTVSNVVKEPMNKSSVRIFVTPEIKAEIVAIQDQGGAEYAPDMCIHDTVLTEGLARVGVKDSLVGQCATLRTVEEIVDSVEGLGHLPEGIDQSVELELELPPGKASVLRTISRECGRVSFPDEKAVISGLLAAGLTEIGVFEAGSDKE